jgi:hypothetical protein
MIGKYSWLRLRILPLILGLAFLSCSLPGTIDPSILSQSVQSGYLITVPSNATATATPFQPVPNTPTVTPTPTPTQTPTPTMTMTPTVTFTPEPLPEVFVGAGDISICDQDGDDHTSELLASIPGTIYTLGDNSNQSGTPDQYLNCFGPSWGRYLGRLYPSPGNHDLVYENGSGYYDYFASVPVERDKGYYSYNVGEWHIIALNSGIDTSAESLQAQWLREDLNNHPSLCSLAYWHHPRWSSGASGNNNHMAAVWQILYDSGVEVVLNGHDHVYERFSPQDPTGALDTTRGIREFIVGTGGASHHWFGQILPNSEARNYDSFGVLKFLLYPDGYVWEFIPVRGASFTDSGFDYCH